MKKFSILCLFGLIISACDNIGGGSLSIKANTTGSAAINDISCKMDNSNECVINLTYSTSGLSGLSLKVRGTTGSLLNDFDIQTNKCIVTSGTNNQTCSIPVVYDKTSTGNSEQIYFVLGDTESSNVITLSD